VTYRVETPRLTLRCWNPSDATELRAALDASDHHLRPWIPFMKDEPRSLQETIEWLRGHRAAFDSDQLHRYAVVRRDDDNGSIVGENMLLSRVGPGGLEVGYWTHVDCGGRGYATEASCAMIRVAFEISRVERIEIHCAPGNAPSAAIPAKLGFRHEATLKDRATNTEGMTHDLMIWTLFAQDYPGSAASEVPIRAFDALEREIFNA
jgi:RimJ/RimL family protein N-acetyltransferase